MQRWITLLLVAILFSGSGSAFADEKSDAEVDAWSSAYASWIDVSHNIACPALKPRVDALTKRLGDVQDAFVARYPSYVFPPMIFATRPFIDCEAGTQLVTRAESRAVQIESLRK